MGSSLIEWMNEWMNKSMDEWIHQISLTSMVGSCIIDSAASREFSTSSRIEVYKDFPMAQMDKKNIEK